MTVTDFIRQLPPITRILFLSNATIVAGISLGFLDPTRLAIIWPLIIKRPIPNIYRLISGLVLCPTGNGIKPLVNLYYLHMFCRDVEVNKFNNNNGGKMVQYLVIILIPIYISSYFLPVYSLFDSLISAIIYTWSHDHPNTIMNFIFGIQLGAPLMPVASLLMDVFLNGSLYAGIPSLLGIIGGHLYFFIDSIYPKSTGTVSIIDSKKKNHPSFWPFGAGRRLGS